MLTTQKLINFKQLIFLISLLNEMQFLNLLQFQFLMNKTLKSILLNALLFAAIASTFAIIKFTHSCNCLNKLFFCDLSTLDLASQAAKWTIFRALLARIGLYLFVHAFIIMNIRIFTKKSSPATEDDPTSIKVLNRIITNTIEQSAIFVGLYVFFLFDKSGDRFTSSELLVFASWFLLARIIFSIGYIFGSLIGVSTLRAFGFSLNVATILMLIEINFCPVNYLTSFFFGK